MTETEWLALTDVMELPWEFAKHLSRRKCLLCAVAACRTVEHLLCDAGRQSLAVAERHADGNATEEECEAAAAIVVARIPPQTPSAYGAVSWAFATYPPSQVMQMACYNAVAASSRPPTVYADRLRDIFGSPFRRIPIDSAWVTPSVVSLAEIIYRDRAFGRMPELAAALEQAGCSEREIVDHCRGTGPHVPGCWVVDQLIGRE
jgi:hypothetical protein